MRAYRVALRAFPRTWRTRYGQELLGLLGEDPQRPAVRTWLSIVRLGLAERAHHAVRSFRGGASREEAEVKFKRPANLVSGRRRRVPRWWAGVVAAVAVVAAISPVIAHQLDAVPSSQASGPAVEATANSGGHCRVENGEPWVRAYRVTAGKRVYVCVPALNVLSPAAQKQQKALLKGAGPTKYQYSRAESEATLLSRQAQVTNEMYHTAAREAKLLLGGHSRSSLHFFAKSSAGQGMSRLPG